MKDSVQPIMKKFIQRLKTFSLTAGSVPWFILILSLFSFGLLLPWFGFSWDDWPFVWIAHQYGNQGLASYFSTNRPVWGVFYQLSTSLLGDAPWQWQLFGILFRWFTAVLLWLLMRALWPKRKSMAVWAALIFLVYPGFRQQAIAITYGHFYLVYGALITSLLFMVLAYRQPRRFALFTGLSLLFSAVNLYSMEYFFTLEILRPVILFGLLAADQEEKKFIQTLKLWLPYALVFISSIVWRVFLFPYQTQNYQPLLLTTLKHAPLVAIGQLILRISRDVICTSVLGPMRAFQVPDIDSFGKVSTLVYAVLVGLMAVLSMLFFLAFREKTEGDKRTLIWPIGLGLLGILIAGWPFWLTDLPIGLEYPNSRFTIPFILGVAVFWAAIFEGLPLPRWVRNVVLSIWLAFSIGQQFISANDFRRDWEVQQQLFWQTSWRIPELAEDTTVLINELPIQYASDNSLTAPLNWMYSGSTAQGEMHYLLAYPTIRLGSSIPSYTGGTPITENYLAAIFHGSSDQMLSVYFDPPGCVHVLDAEIDNYNSLLPPALRETVPYTHVEQIITDGDTQAEPPRSIFKKEPEHRWCYYYEKAELARQQKNWPKVAELGNMAFNLDDYPNDPVERFVFIEGYAHNGDWQRALQLTQVSGDVTDLIHPMICKLWQRIDRETGTSVEKDDTIQTVRMQFECNP